MKDRLKICILWHHHQPYYIIKAHKRAVLPWVRMHCYKDYVDMPMIASRYPAIKTTFNLVPSLIKQILDYQSHDVMDDFEELSFKNPSHLSGEDRIFIARNFFSVNYDNCIASLPRYKELHSKKAMLGDAPIPPDLFSDQELIDLQVLFNIAWCGNHLRENTALQELIKKGSNYHEQDKKRLREILKSHLASVIPTYRELAEQGIISLTTSPFYHPILPLIYDNYMAKRCQPDLRLPNTNFRQPEDARKQVAEAIELHKRTFGVRPKGCWTPEGSVSPEIIELLAENGFAWCASDEMILKKSLKMSGLEQDTGWKYLPYRYKTAHGEVVIFFRDQKLSDLIGFSYAKMGANEAAGDFVNRLHEIRDTLPDDGKPYVVSVILDGENAWEWFPKNGKEFLENLYESLSGSENLQVISFDNYLEGLCKSLPVLPKLYSGSWIKADFSTWIGHEEKNRAWDLLYKARQDIQSHIDHSAKIDKQKIVEAMGCLYRAEGSDWFWWYGDDNFTSFAAEFDYIFRQHLKEAYHALGLAPDSRLDEPIKTNINIVKNIVQPTGIVTAQIDGMVSDYYEWLNAGFYDPAPSLGTMKMGEKIIEGMYFGCDREYLFIRLQPVNGKQSVIEQIDRIRLTMADTNRIIVILKRQGVIYTVESIRLNSSLIEEDENGFIGMSGEIVELRAPLIYIKSHDLKCFSFSVELYYNNELIQRIPLSGSLETFYPTEEFLAENWIV